MNCTSTLTCSCIYSQVVAELERLLHKYKHEKVSITVTGHSLGSAIATINAYDIVLEWKNLTGEPWDPSKEGRATVTVFSFAGPRVGNDAFRDQLDALGVKVLRMVNVNDMVPRVPGIPALLLNDSVRFLQDLIDKLPNTYTHVGVELKLNNLDSPLLNPKKATLPNLHNLEQYLHLVDGHQGTRKEFKLTTPRPVELINKATDFLANHPHVPESWWQAENKGLVLNQEGKWVQPKREIEDIPKPSNSDV